MKQILTLLFFSSLLFPIDFIAIPAGSALPQINNGIPLSPNDSIILSLKTAKEDTSKINSLNILSRQYLNTGSYEEAIKYAKQSQSLSEELGFKSGLGDSYSNIGVACWYQGIYERALENHFQALKIRESIGDKQGIGNSYNNIGLVYLNQGNYEKGLENYLKALKIREEIGDKRGTANSYNNMGVIYLKQNNFEKALDNYVKALKIREEIGDKRGIGMSYNNIGLIYQEHGNFKQSLDNLLKGLKIREEIGDKIGTADSYLNIGNIYFLQKNYEKALDFYFKSSKINQKIGNKRGIAVSFNNIGTCYLMQNKFEESGKYISLGLKIFNEIGNKEGIKDAYYAFAELYDRKRDFKKAFEYQKLYSDIKDTLLNEASSGQIAEMNTKYESEKKDKALIKKDAEITNQQAEAEKQVILRNAFIMGFTLVLVLAFFIYRGYRQKQKANKLLDEKNEKITDSINYAKRIQESILPPLDEIKKHLPESFVLYQPKDIVSGDFYWFHVSEELGDGSQELEGSNRKSDEKNSPNSRHRSANSVLQTPRSKLFIAAVDCTGHGVPGAFMSMMGYNLLEQVVKKNHIYQPAMVLNELSKLVVESLRQTDQRGKVNDGMEIALITLMMNDKNSGFEKGDQNPLYDQLEYAGAHNSLYLIRNGTLHETRADKASIGFSSQKSFQFVNHTIALEKGDCIYIFSDGFVDQFGGPDNEKFYYQPFRELLIEIHQLSMEEQKQKLEKVASEWRGDRAQIDDILVIGLRV